MDFVWQIGHLLCGECGLAMALAHESFGKQQQIVRVVVFCRNPDCSEHVKRYEVEGGKLAVKPYGTHRNQGGPDAAAGTAADAQANSGSAEPSVPPEPRS